MDVIMYHAGCPDGWCAAYIAQRKYPHAELIPMSYGKPIPFKQLMGKDVLVVDFSWTQDKIRELKSCVTSLTIYDHHKTAVGELEAADDGWDHTYAWCYDVKRSGAGITWDMLFGIDSGPAQFEPRPWWVDYIEDYDLWNFNLPMSREINAYLHALPKTVEAWDSLPPHASAAITRGEAIQMYIKMAAERTASDAAIGRWKGQEFAVVNCPSVQASEVGELLYTTKVKNVLMWTERDDDFIKFSLRSAADGIDVGTLAKTFPAGGGHTHAAGFELPILQARQLIDSILGRDIRK